MKTNCPNCGAPLDKDGKCTYCETAMRKTIKSELIITASEIRITAKETDDE